MKELRSSCQGSSPFLVVKLLCYILVVQYCCSFASCEPHRKTVQIKDEPPHTNHNQKPLTSSPLQTNWEKVFLSIPSEAYAFEYLSYYTSLPHVAGTIEDYQTAEYTLQKFKEFGLNNSEIQELEVLLSYPKQRSLRLLSPKSFTAKLQEDYYEVDPATADPRVVPTFNGYAPSGNVTGELVYVNYASIEDFAALQAMGVNVTGKIGICRYGGLFRGTKAMIAQLHGMIGLIIYSDPADDGYVQGVTFPNGPWRPKSGVQRGSVQFLSICPGDPTRKVCSNDPNYNWTDGIPAIPVQPISWGDALPLLQSLEGTMAPKNFQGGLNFTYYIGPGPAVVNLFLEVEFVTTKIWNVIATIEGVENDRAVIIGNHRDAWVFGGADPNSGTAAMLEVARGFGQLLQQGWKPQRNVIFASWDGEEYGLLGSTGWVEANANTMDKTAVAYLNVDVAVTGPEFYLSCTPSLESVVRQAATQVTDPNSGKPLSQVWTTPVSPLGSGSDFTAFIDHFGIASADMGFDGAYGVYHSVYDDLFWMKNFGDPGFLYHKACAQLWGLVALKLVDSEVIPFNYTNYGVQLQEYFQATQALLASRNYTLDLTQLQNAIVAFQQAAKQAQEEMNKPHKDSSLNDRLIFTERQFLGELGLPNRPYYKHVVQAPGLYAGYAPAIFPGLTQVIEANTWNQTLAEEQYTVLFTQIGNAASFLAGNQFEEVIN